jgi:hypothetical protein
VQTRERETEKMKELENEEFKFFVVVRGKARRRGCVYGE